MHPFFIAHGPSFKQKYISEPFNNVDIYPLLCYMLGVTPAQHDGDFDNIKHILVDNGNRPGGNGEHHGPSMALLTASKSSVGNCLQK